MYVIRPITMTDAAEGYLMAEEVGLGMTSWPANMVVIKSKIQASINSFNGNQLDREKQVYLLALEASDGSLAGITAVYPDVGKFFPSCLINHRSDGSFLSSTFERFSSKTELGTMILREGHRQTIDGQSTGLGKALSKSRLMLIAADHNKSRFSEELFAEYRGYLRNGKSLYGEWFANKMGYEGFAQVDQLIGEIGYEAFYEPLKDKVSNISFDDIPSKIKILFHRAHDSSMPARAILAAEGMDHTLYMGLHDAGPQASAIQSKIQTISACRVLKAGRCLKTFSSDALKVLVSTNDVSNFRGVFNPIIIEGEHVLLSEEALDKLCIQEGALLRVAPEAYDLSY